MAALARRANHSKEMTSRIRHGLRYLYLSGFLKLGGDFLVKQKRLTMPAMIAFITFMNMFIPLSTDLYLPALPEMGKYFGAGEFLVGLTLTIFFFVFAVSIILFGPLSDKYGRKPVLIFGAGIFTAASLFCAMSLNIYMLIAGRFFQALGAGAVITVATALIKDCFRGSVMAKILAITQALGVIAPMVAPIIGGILLRFTAWHGAFYLLTFMGAVNLWLAFMLTETLPKEKRYDGSVVQSLSLLWKLGKQTHFMLVLMMVSILAAPYMAYLSASSFVYVEQFKLTAQEYSYFFAVNSAAAIAGPILYLKLKKHMSNLVLTKLCFIVAGISGLLVLFPAHLSAPAFLLSFLPFTVIEAVARPLAMEVLLNEAKENAGTASAMINFIPTLLGSVGMALGTLPWGDFITGLAIIILASTALSVLLFKFVDRI